MATTTQSFDRAEITLAVELTERRLLNGSWARVKVPLPWSFVKFPDATETTRYVTPAGSGLHALAAQPYNIVEEVMGGHPFPHEANVGPRPTSGDDRIPGPSAVHFFGNGV